MPRAGTPSRKPSKKVSKAKAKIPQEEEEEEQQTVVTPTPASQSEPNKPKVHVYTPPEASILSEYIFFPFYDWIVEYFPRGWVPNYMTIVGITCTFVASMLQMFCLPRDTSFPRPFAVVPTPGSTANSTVQFVSPQLTEYFSWVDQYVGGISNLLLCCGLLNAIYCIADNTDGRQARRTKQTSLIGEYLDHGLDGVTALLSAFLLVLQLGHTIVSAAVITACVAFVTQTAHVLHFSDKIFIWGNRLVSVDEAMVAFALGPIIHAFIGPSLASIEFFNTGYSVQDFAMTLFFLSQISVTLSILGKNWGNCLDISFLSLCVTTAGFFYLAVTQDQKPVGLLPYPAVWGASFSFAASIIAHIPILAQCARIHHQIYWPLALVALCYAAFVREPIYGMGFFMVGHLVQILYNVQFIKRVRGDHH